MGKARNGAFSRVGEPRARARDSRGGFGSEDAAEAWAGELDADDALILGVAFGDVDDAAAGGEVGFFAARDGLGKGDANFEIATDGQVERRNERGAVAADIFAGSFFFEGDAVRIASADFQRQTDGDPTFRALPGAGRTELDHGLEPHFLLMLLLTPAACWRKNAPRCRAAQRAF